MEAWWQRGSLKSPTNINDALCEAKYGASYRGLSNNGLNYKLGAQIKQIMTWSSFATERSLIVSIR